MQQIFKSYNIQNLKMSFEWNMRLNGLGVKKLKSHLMTTETKQLLYNDSSCFKWLSKVSMCDCFVFAFSFALAPKQAK